MIQKTTETGGVGRVKLITKRQSLGFEQSLTEAWNSTTSLFGYNARLRRLVNKHTHTINYVDGSSVNGRDGGGEAGAKIERSGVDR